eukprot:Hpha_TRINITY_DN23946_c0_g1::TRINITY_DN23946_c0_g1_i1::g.137808::m.137808
MLAAYLLLVAVFAVIDTNNSLAARSHCKYLALSGSPGILVGFLAADGSFLTLWSELADIKQGYQPFDRVGNSNPSLGEFEYASVSLGTNMGCAVSTLGELACWEGILSQFFGPSYTGSEYRGPMIGAPVIPRVCGGHKVVQVSVAFYHSCVLCSDMSVRCWGENIKGQVGCELTSTCGVESAKQGTRGLWEMPAPWYVFANASDPLIVDLGTDSQKGIQIATNKWQSCVLLDDGRVR